MSESNILVKIPKERVGVLVGSCGSVKKKMEEMLGVELEVDSLTGNVNIRLRPNTSDPSLLFLTRDVTMAIGRGFSPDKALRLLDEDTRLDVIDLRELFENSKSDIQRVKSRVIGSKGKTRRLIEELTGAAISVYGDTISIIGETAPFEVAKTAVEMLIKGRLHKTVYSFLHYKRRELKEEEMELWKKPPPS